jgi:Tfp pilus assembly protein PilX
MSQQIHPDLLKKNLNVTGGKMRGALIIVVLIAMLIVGILVVKDMKTESVDGVTKQEAIEKAEKSVKTAEDAINRITDKAKKSTEY